MMDAGSTGMQSFPENVDARFKSFEPQKKSERRRKEILSDDEMESGTSPARAQGLQNDENDHLMGEPQTPITPSRPDAPIEEKRAAYLNRIRLNGITTKHNAVRTPAEPVSRRMENLHEKFSASKMKLRVKPTTKEEALTNINKPAIRRLARRAGGQRMGGLIYEEGRELIGMYVSEVLSRAMNTLRGRKRNKKTNNISALCMVETINEYGKSEHFLTALRDNVKQDMKNGLFNKTSLNDNENRQDENDSSIY